MQQTNMRRVKQEEEDEEENAIRVKEELEDMEEEDQLRRKAPLTVKSCIEMAANNNCCAGCLEPIKDKFIFEVIGLHWHQNCVQCSDCGLKLNERCNTYEGKLYCKSDYSRRFAPKCFACRGAIERTELVQRIKEDRVYHLKCFTCNSCNKQLKAGEQLHLMDKKLICKQDFNSQFSKLSKSSNGFEAHLTPNEQSGGQEVSKSADVEAQQQQQSYYTLISGQQQAALSAAKLEEEMELLEEDCELDDECDLDEEEEEDSMHIERLSGAFERDEEEKCESQNADENEENHRFELQLPASGLAASAGDTAKRKRQRRQQKLRGNRKLATRNGQSILNGSVGSMRLQAHQTDPVHLHHKSHPVSSSASSASSSNSSISSSLVSLSNNGQQQSQQKHSNHQIERHLSNANQLATVNQTSGNHKPTRVRTVLNEKQLQTLRDCYAQNPRPDALLKEHLVDVTGLSSRVIRVWFQNKRCKDKKKSILYKQMQQHEKDGRHLAGLALMRGVPMVASSPIHYDDHSSVSSQMGGPQAPLDPTAGSPQARSGVYPTPAQTGPEPMEVHAYQPNWKSLIDYAHQHHQTTNPNSNNNNNGGQHTPDRVNAASPRYQQLIGQIHGYSSTTDQNNEQVVNVQGPTMLELQTQQPRSHFNTSNTQNSNYQQSNEQLHLQSQQHLNQPHLHQFQQQQQR